MTETTPDVETGETPADVETGEPVELYEATTSLAAEPPAGEPNPDAPTAETSLAVELPPAPLPGFE